MSPDIPITVKRKPRVYIAAPYSNGYLLDNLRNAFAAGEEIIRSGGNPYVPHQSALHDLLFTHPPDFWYNFDLVWLEVCDALFRVRGYSPGSDNEEKFCIEHDIPIFYNYNDFTNWLLYEWYKEV